jgi:FKBP-type peptidyl-prolyl cis-trans isomerase 2
MGSIKAKCGHVKLQLNKGEPLAGKTLEFALTVIGEPKGPDKIMFYDIVYKLRTGQ